MAEKDGSSEMIVGWIIILVIIAVILYFIYRANTIEILNFFRWVRYGEIWLITVLTPSDFTVTLPTGQIVNVQQWFDSIGNMPAEQLNFKLLTMITGAALVAYKWPVILCIAAIGLWTYTKGPGTHYTRVHNLDSFIKFQANAFPIIAPFVNFNPGDMPPRPPGTPVPAKLPVFAEALGPEEWIAYNQIPVPDGTLDEKTTLSALARQLGKRWRGVKNLKPYQQVLLAGFCLKAARKREEADDLMGRFALCWSHDKGLQLGKDPALVKRARKILATKEMAHALLKKCNQHAWETTAIMRALLYAREEGGVMAPAQFVWLRGYDRNLWYALNGLGRNSSFAEAFGSSSHFRAEKRAQRPIPKPKVKDAFDGLVTYMDSLDARPIPTLDYSYSDNKRGIKKLKTT